MLCATNVTLRFIFLVDDSNFLLTYLESGWHINFEVALFQQFVLLKENNGVSGTFLSIFSRLLSWITHSWDIPEGTGWNPHKDKKHMGVMRLRHSISLFGYKVPMTSMPVEAYQVSPNQKVSTIQWKLGPISVLECNRIAVFVTKNQSIIYR